jgi:hypothetical protein
MDVCGNGSVDAGSVGEKCVLNEFRHALSPEKENVFAHCIRSPGRIFLEPGTLEAWLSKMASLN